MKSSKQFLEKTLPFNFLFINLKSIEYFNIYSVSKQDFLFIRRFIKGCFSESYNSKTTDKIIEIYKQSYKQSYLLSIVFYYFKISAVVNFLERFKIFKIIFLKKKNI